MSKSFKIIINAGSGHDEKKETLSVITSTLENAGHRVDVIQLSKTDDMAKKCHDAALAAKADQSIVVAAGGDGTINTVAGFCHSLDVPMGVVPLGTFNFFARDHNIPTDVADAANVLITGGLRQVPIAVLNDQIFLVHAGIGLYSDIMRNREKDKQQYGRYRIVAFISSFMSLMNTGKIHTVTIKTETETITRRTLNIFVGNNNLQLEKLGLASEGEVKPDELAIVILKPLTTLQKIRLAFWGLVRQMQKEPSLETLTAKEFSIGTAKKTVSIAIDGERMTFTSPLEFKRISAGLKLIVPHGDIVL